MGNGWKIAFFVLLALIIIGANVFAWYYFVKGKRILTTTPPAVFPPTATITPLATSSPIPIADEANLIKQAVFKLTNLDESKAEVTINKNTGKFATGNVKEFEAVGGAYWIAAKTADGWVGVYAGQANPQCSQIAPYNFPKDMVPECLDASGKVIKR